MNSLELQTLVAAKRPESLQIEFKRDLPGGSDSAKSEFLADVCALANAAGGSLLFGISEQDGCANEIVGLSNDDLDKTRLWLDGIIRSGIEPRLARVSIHTIEVDGKTVVEVAIGQSFLRPHWVSARGERRFYIRTSVGKAPMSIDEVRTAFRNAGDVFGLAQKWRADCIRHLNSAGGRPSSEPDTIWMTLHICPMSAFSESPTTPYFDPRPPSDISKRLRTVSSDNLNCRPHYDGLLTEERAGDSSVRERLLIRRDFRIEALWKGGRQGEHAKILFAGHNETTINQWLDRFLIWATENGYPFPAIALLSVFGAQDSRVPSSFSHYPTTAGTMELRPAFIEDSTISPSAVMRDAYDHLWQTYGFNHCVLYDEDGNFDQSRYNPRGV